MGSLIIFTIISQAISRKVRGSSLSFLDRSLGLLAGIILSTLISIIGFLELSGFKPVSDPGKKSDWIANKMFPLLDWGSTRFHVLPKNLKKNLNFYFQEKRNLIIILKFLAPKIKSYKKKKIWIHGDRAKEMIV